MRRQGARAGRFAALLYVAAVALAGCGLLPSRDAAAPAAAASAPAASAPLRVQVDVVAPPQLQALLEKHLDLIRLGAMAGIDVDDTEWARLIEAAPAQARELLKTEGYFDALVSAERVGGGDGAPVQVRMDVKPGPRAVIGRVRIEFVGDLEVAAETGDAYAAGVRSGLRESWPLSTGQPFRNEVWSDAKAAALARLRGAGYANAVWSGTGAQLDPETHEMRLFLVADSGPLYRVGTLEIEGLTAQDAETVRHLSLTHRGEPVTETLLLDFQDRLQKSGLFASISVTLDAESPDPAGARLLVRLTEAPLQVYTFGVGYSANTGLRASVEHVYRRVFGYAATARNKLEWGQRRQFWTGELSAHPGENLYRNLVGGTIENLESDTDTVLSQRLRVGRAQDGTRLERIAFVEVERSVRRTDTSRTDTVATSLNGHAVWRDVDSIVLPTRGYTFSGQVGGGWSRGNQSRSGPFGRAYGRATGYLPVGDTWYGQARLELGHIEARPGVAAPESQRFRVGGDDSVRGYAYRSLGPLVNGAVGSGNSMFTASVELARPISASLPSVWGAVFVDAGQAADRLSDLRPAVGYGLGVRWRSPVGPLRIDWAYGQEVRKWRLHFSVGIAF